MNGIIEKDGSLQVLRRGQLRAQWCPFTADRSGCPQRRCGDLCPHFHEFRRPADARTYVQLSCGQFGDICIDTDNRPIEAP